MPGNYIPPHLRSKKKTQCNNYKWGDKLLVQSSKPKLFNSRFNNMFEGAYQSKPKPIPRKKDILGLDHKRSGCITLYSKRHDRIFLMGSDEDTFCISIHPRTLVVKKLIDLPYFRRNKPSTQIHMRPRAAWFDENENFIFILSFCQDKNDYYETVRIIRYDILKNQLKDVFLDNTMRFCFEELLSVCAYATKNKYHVNIIGLKRMEKTKLISHYCATSSSDKFELESSDMLTKSYYQRSCTYSSRTKKMYLMGWELKNEEEFGILTLSSIANETTNQKWEYIAAPSIPYLKKLHYYGFCMVDDRYCVFVGGKRPEPRSQSVVHDDIYVYDVVTNSWEKSEKTLKIGLAKVSCIYDDRRRRLHYIGGLEQHSYGSWNEYEKQKLHEVVSIRDIIPGFTDIKMVHYILKLWFDESEEKINGRWNDDISKLIYSYN